MNQPRMPDQDIASVALRVSRPISDDAEALDAMRSLQQRLFDVTAAPQRFGRYEIIGRIGQGATGVVYEARDPRVDRRVALKVMRETSDEVLDRESPGRFRREANILAKLSHPNIVKVHDVGEANNRSFIAMEHVSGGHLGRWLADCRPNWAEVHQVFLGVGRGLAAAHDAGLIHRDIKPSNILVGDDGRVLLSDFDLAERTPAVANSTSFVPGTPDEAATTSPSQLAPVSGTPGYMAPEQIFAEAIDQRADVFGFSVTLWEALYGQRPYPGDSFAEAIVSFSKVPRKPVAPRSGVPKWLRNICLKGLASNREERWESMHDVVAALEAGPALARRRRTLALTFAMATLAALAWWSGIFG